MSPEESTPERPERGTAERRAPERRSRKARRTRDTLAQAAFELVLDRGLRYVTVEEIAEAADVDRRTFSRYFASKEAAALDSLRGDGDRINAALRARPAEEPPLLAYRRAVLAWLADPRRSPGTAAPGSSTSWSPPRTNRPSTRPSTTSGWTPRRTRSPSSRTGSASTRATTSAPP